MPSTQVLPHWIWAGIPRDILLQFHDAISGFIKTANLQKASMEAHMRLMDGKKVLSEEPIVKQNIRGGIRAHHIHFDGDIYLLNQEQWKEFSTKLVEGMQEKLGSAGTVKGGI